MINFKNLIIFTFFTFLSTYLNAFPGYFSDDTSTVAIWSFDDRGSDTYAVFENESLLSTSSTTDTTCGDGYALKEVAYQSGPATITTKNVRPDFGKAMDDLAWGNYLCNRHLSDLAEQTFEFWVKWDEDSQLPSINANEQHLVTKRIGGGHSLNFYFTKTSTGARLNLEMRSDPNDSATTETVHLDIDSEEFEENTWYHVAYSIEETMAGSVTDVDVNLFFNSENNTDTTPTPSLSSTVSNFDYPESGYYVMVGKFSGTGSNYFRGQIGTSRYSSIARTDFDSFISGDITKYTGKKSFFVGQYIKASDRPDTSPYGVARVGRLSPSNDFWAAGADKDVDFPDRDSTDETTCETATLPDTSSLTCNDNNSQGNKLYFIDIENLDAVYDLNSTTEERQGALQKLMSVTDWAHHTSPHLRIGYYGILPNRQANNDFVSKGENQITPPAENWVKWDKLNEELKPLAKHVDVLFPSLYIIKPHDGDDNAEIAEWSKYADANLYQVKKHTPGKKVYPFISPRIYRSDDTTGIISGTYWRGILEYLYKNTDGFIIWTKSSDLWADIADDTDPDNWWYQTIDFMEEKGLY